MSHVSILGVGGTISSVRAEEGARPTMGAASIVDGVLHGLPIEARPRDVLTVSSREVTPLDIWNLAEAIREEVAAGATGVVVLHGTDSLEETAYGLALLLDRDVPVALCGAMRVSSHVGADGPANVRAAAVTAADPRMARYGPVVVMHDEVHLARYVAKVDSVRVGAFGSPGAGPVAVVSEDTVRLLHGALDGADTLPVTRPPSARVNIVWGTAGMDRSVVDAVAAVSDALVLAALGGGHVSAAGAQSLVELAQGGTPVVLATRCVSSRVLQGTYGGPGSERHLIENGLIPAGTLSPVKARLRTLFGMSAGLPVDTLFEEYT